MRPADSPRLTIDSALGKPPDLILLDIRLPDMDGFEVCASLKRDERTRDIPILFIRALQETKDKVRGFEAGKNLPYFFGLRIHHYRLGFRELV